MSMDDISTYMARREKSTLTAPNPEASPAAANLLNPSQVGTDFNSPVKNSHPGTPQHNFKKVTPQGSMSMHPTLSTATHAPASTHQQQHLHDVARLVIQHQREQHSDPLRLANNSLAGGDLLSLDRRKDCDFESGDLGLINFLRSVPHLYMISNSDMRELSRNILRREFGLHDTILSNKQRVNHVYIVLKGCVEVYSVSKLQWDPQSTRADDMLTHHERIGSVEVSNLFCIDSVVFSEPSEFLYCAGQEKTLLGLIPAALFLSILNRNVATRQSIGRKLADHMDIFICFKDFCRHIFSHETAKHEYLPIWQILAAYERLQNCIHTKRASNEIDVDAWNYAIKRLPENLTTTFVFDLVRALPPFLTTRMRDLAKSPAAAIGDVRYIVTKERRRCSWQLGMEGKTLVLLRDGFTDLLDFITCLCIHIIESNKLRGRLQGMVSPPAVDILDAKLQEIAARQGESLSHVTFSNTNAATGGVDAKDVKEVLAKMPLSEKERSGLHRNWGEGTLKNIYTVIMHREEYLLRVDVSNSRQFMTDPFHDWALNLRKKLMLSMKLDPRSHLPEDLIIDIISSNTHSTKSLLSPFARVHREGILAHCKEKKPELYNLPWAVQEDLVYSHSGTYMASTDGLRKDFNEWLRWCGFEVLEDTAMTGLQVDIVPVNQLDMSLIDPLLATRNCKPAGPRHFILNMDFAFGAQADGITATLVDTFGKHIRSFNVMGKAGGIASSMRRGDIQLASHVLLSKSSDTTEDYLDELRSCGNLDIPSDFVQTLCGEHSKIQVFNGPVLTIPGTMLQNDKLLLYYRHIWHCVGVEMEGSYFCRQLKENLKAKLLNDDLITRFAYYTSDMPLHSLQGDASLSTPMRPNEGTPPLYAVARALLIRILGGSDQPQKPELDEVCGPSDSLRQQQALKAALRNNEHYSSNNNLMAGAGLDSNGGESLDRNTPPTLMRDMSMMGYDEMQRRREVPKSPGLMDGSSTTRPTEGGITTGNTAGFSPIEYADVRSSESAHGQANNPAFDSQGCHRPVPDNDSIVVRETTRSGSMSDAGFAAAAVAAVAVSVSSQSASQQSTPPPSAVSPTARYAKLPPNAASGSQGAAVIVTPNVDNGIVQSPPPKASVTSPTNSQMGTGVSPHQGSAKPPAVYDEEEEAESTPHYQPSHENTKIFSASDKSDFTDRYHDTQVVSDGYHEDGSDVEHHLRASSEDDEAERSITKSTSTAGPNDARRSKKNSTSSTSAAPKTVVPTAQPRQMPSTGRAGTPTSSSASPDSRKKPASASGSATKKK
eukprot:GILI01005579.1.p1 GENE.GILI01005579.1~~GILI01005579.1.p1  ORF type:complete len:1307 (-),score=315.73 GILI01005579.1:131-3976(-)